MSKLTQEATECFIVGKSKAGIYQKGVRDAIGVKSALYEKMVRCAVRAGYTNPMYRKPWLKNADWSSGASARVGQVFTYDKRDYLALGNGNLGTTAPTHVTGSGISPGGTGILLSFVGGTGVLTDDPDAPIVTSSNATPSSPLTCWWNPTVFTEKYRTFGGDPTYFQSIWNRPYAFTHKADGTRAAYGTAISFWTDAPKFAIQLNSNGSVRFTIDNRYYKTDAYDPYRELANDGGWVTFDFGSGQRKPRLITVESNIPSGPYFGGVRTDELSRVWRDERECIKCASFGDSIQQGSALGPFMPGGTVTARLGKALGWEDIRNCSRGGTGWLNTGPDVVPDYTFYQRIDEQLIWGPEAWTFFGGVNDMSFSTAAVANEVTKSLTKIRDNKNEGYIFIFGVLPVNDSRVAPLDAAIGNAVTAFNDPYKRTFFCSLLNPGDGIPILTHNGNNQALNFSTTAGLYISTNDGLHPTDLGTTAYANAQEWHIRNKLGLLN